MFTVADCNTGDDACCDGQCAAGEGDCDYDSDCFGVLKCGDNNCMTNFDKTGKEWDSTDDCCY